MDNADLSIYMFYTGSDSAYIDDYEIIYYNRPGKPEVYETGPGT
jgi:hypothetical protein